MKEIDVQELINVNYRLCTLLGIATHIIHTNSNDTDWWMKAIQAVVYENKPIPPLPNENT